jgi:hypothetical protein
MGIARTETPATGLNGRSIAFQDAQPRDLPPPAARCARGGQCGGEGIATPSFLRTLPAKLESTRTRAESLGGTSTTDSPAAASLTARCRPRPPAFSTAQRRSGNRFAQRSSDPKPVRSYLPLFT